MHITAKMKSPLSTKPLSASPQDTPTWIYDVLEPEQLSAMKYTRRFEKRKLSRGTLVLLWALRLYVVVMFFLIAYQIWSVVHA